MCASAPTVQNISPTRLFFRTLPCWSKTLPALPKTPFSYDLIFTFSGAAERAVRQPRFLFAQLQKIFLGNFAQVPCLFCTAAARFSGYFYKKVTICYALFTNLLLDSRRRVAYNKFSVGGHSATLTRALGLRGFFRLCRTEYFAFAYKRRYLL